MSSLKPLWLLSCWALLFLGITSICLFAQQQSGVQQAPRRVKVLLLGDNGHHEPLIRLRQVHSMLSERGIDVIYTDRMADLNPANLARFEVLMVYANQILFAEGLQRSTATNGALIMALSPLVSHSRRISDSNAGNGDPAGRRR